MAENEKSSISSSTRAEFKAIMAELNKESDRAAVILAVAKIDLLLYEILQSVLVPSTGSHDELLDGDSALGTLSSRINIVHRLGLIDAHFARALHIARRIRNNFAHELSSSDLSLGTHRDRVRELCAPFRRYKKYEDFRKAFTNKEEDTPSVNFRTAVAIMMIRLEKLCDTAKPIAASDMMTLLADWDNNEPEPAKPVAAEPAPKAIIPGPPGLLVPTKQ